MPVVRIENAPHFQLPGLTVTGLASPSRGARETSAWRVCLASGAEGIEHSVDREEIFIALAGQAVAMIDGEPISLAAGDTLIVPPDRPFSLANPHSQAFDAIALAPVGMRACTADGVSFAPPWTE